MDDYFSKFLDTSDFPARWYCGNWSEFLGWLHIISDVATFAAYFAIPTVLFYFARKRSDLRLSKLLMLFGAFILACGTVHLIEAIIFWHPIYRVSGAMKFITATVSWATVVALIRYAPRIMAIPSLAETNERLKVEINQRRESQAGLRRLTARYEALLNGTASIIWTTDVEGKLRTEQESWTRYTGQDFDALREFGYMDAVHPEDRAELFQRWKYALKTNSKYTSTHRLWHYDSQTYRRTTAEAMPVKNDAGVTIEWIGTNTDIEDKSLAESALGIAQHELAKQKDELELIYESAPVGMSLIDRDFRFVRINETLARINGFQQHEHIGKRAGEMLPDIDDQLKPIYRQVFDSGQPVLNVEIVGKTPASNESRTWLGSYFPLKEYGPDGISVTVTAVNAIVQDITQRKAQETRLIESEQAALAANRSKSEFLANMSHEIRTPMAAILGYADVLLGHLKDPDNRNCVLIMKRNGEHLLELINDILDLSRIEAGKMDVDVEPVQLPQLVADIQSLMQVRAEEKKVKFDVEFKGQVPRAIRTDATRLRQVLINLIGNAIKFTDEGEVRLQVQFVNDADPPIVEFAIVDTGIGMTEEQIERLFRPFSQGDSSVTRQYGGSGLGLAISQRLVEMLDGYMDLRSTPGEGSTFFVRLPLDSMDSVELIQPNLIVRDQTPEPLLAETPSLSCRVLVVDDRRDVRHISLHFLEKAGAKVSTAEDGQHGIDAALAARDEGNSFDLIVMDMQMPRVDGMEAVARLRSAGIEWPIVALTADAMKGDRDKYLNGGCDDYLSKPIDHAKLVGMAAKYTQDVTHEELVRRRRERVESLRRSMDVEE